MDGQEPERGRSQGRGARYEWSAAQRALILDGSPSEGYEGQNQLQRGARLYCVGTLPVEDKGKEEVKRTNEIKTAIPLLEAIDIAGKDVSGDALLTQRELADYLVGTRKAHYYFTVKGNQPGLLEALVTME